MFNCRIAICCFALFVFSPLNVIYASEKEMKVLVISYIPVLDTGSGIIDHNIVGDHLRNYLSLDLLENLEFVSQKLAVDMTNSTKYRGHSDPNSVPYINFSIYKSINYFEALPQGFRYYKQDPNDIVYRPDYIKVLQRENICDYVDNKGIREVWLWGYHFDKLEPVESNMSMGLNDKPYWNRSGYGDYSNSESTNDLPTCLNTYVLYNYNYDKTQSTYRSLHNHVHQLERLFLELSVTRQETQYPLNFFASKFLGYNGNWFQYKPLDYPYCGWGHWAPNSSVPITNTSQGDNYNFSITSYKNSNCENWDPEIINLEPVSCKNWAGDNCGVNYDEDGRRYHMWWMQSLAGKDNTAFYNGYKVLNWWDAYLDFGEVRRKGEQMISKYVVDYNADRLVNSSDYRIVVDNLFRGNGQGARDTLVLLFYMINIENEYF